MSRFTARLLAAGTALVLAGTALAQTSPQPEQTPGGQAPTSGSDGGGLILPGAISSGSSVAAPQQAPQQAPGPAMGPAAGPAAGPSAGPRQAPAAQAPVAGPAAPAGAPAASKVGTVTGNWQVGPQVYTDGSFKLCEAQASFDNGLALVFLALPVPQAEQQAKKLPPKIINLVIGVPGANMPPGQGPAVKLKLDGKLEQMRGSQIIQPNAIMTGFDPMDANFTKALLTANKLEVSSPNDTATFVLKGGTKAFKDLNACFDQAMAGKLQLPAPPPAIPPAFAQLLIDAGLKDAHPLPVDKMSPQERPGDFAWAVQKDVIGSLRSVGLKPEAGDLEKVMQNYLDSLSKGCQGTYTPTKGKLEKLLQIDMQTGSASCKTDKGEFYANLILYLTKDRQLFIISHEAPAASKAVADNAGNAIAGVLRKKANEPPPAQGAQQPGPAAGPRKQQ
ncbi:hypothetical protein [Nitrospirillum sp. BR 11828]|uniref:hypothetical protein n=1 Tax=Nitrospirillum sp. BR 11828 TaxID=3104325 RepID=UPI002ACA8A5B|nr:hypothetical protein [Nitrospirillum sp. BR 11828]MDZ5646299.1 hypothetical protein [Nitrospirillum sp. BR 11828]